MAYVYPVGIPVAPWGVNETVASVYGDANYYTHWVDNDHPSATDTSNPNGSPTTPRLTLPTLTGLAAGTVIQVRGGTTTPYYTTSQTPVNMSASGTSPSPVFLTGLGATQKPMLRRGLKVNASSSYLVIEGLQWSTVNESICQVRTSTASQVFDRICVRDCEGTGTGISTGGGTVMGPGDDSGSSTFTNIVYLRNTLHDFGDYQAGAQNDYHAFTCGHRTTGFWVLDNVAYHCGGDGFQAGHGLQQATESPTDVFIGRNTFYQFGENGIDIKNLHDCVISSNVLYGPNNTTISDGVALVVHEGGPTTDQGPYNVWVINNYIHDNALGIANSDCWPTKPIWYIGNLIVNMTSEQGLAHGLTGGGDYRVYHNTIVNVGTEGIRFSSAGSDVKGGGNLVVTATEHLEMAAAANPSAWSNDLYWQGGANVAITWLGTTYTSVAAWIAATAFGDNSLQQDPLLTGSYRLTADSPCRGAGLNMSSVETAFQAEFGVSLLKDLDGTVRPNGVWDIGALQYAPSIVTGHLGRGVMGAI